MLVSKASLTTDIVQVITGSLLFVKLQMHVSHNDYLNELYS